MINKKNKPAGLNISQFVENTRQNIRPVSSITPEPATDETEEKKEEDATSSATQIKSPEMQTVIADNPADRETEETAPSVSDEKIEEQSASEETPKRKRTVQQKAIKRDKLMAIRFDKKMHKDISLIKLNYEIDIQDFVYVAVEKFMGEFFPNGKATKEGLEIVQQSLKRIYGKNSENE